MTSNPASVGPAPDGEGWIEWSGGENPVGDTMVEIRCRGGYSMICMASAVSWARRGGRGDIIAYRIAPHPDREAEPTGRIVERLRDALACIEKVPGKAHCALLDKAEDDIKQVLSALSASPPVVEGELGDDLMIEGTGQLSSAALGALRASPCVPTARYQNAVLELQEQLEATTACHPVTIQHWAARALFAAAQHSGWQPIETALPNIRAILFAPATKLYEKPHPDDWEMRVGRPRDWTWATHWMPLPAAPDTALADTQPGMSEANAPIPAVQSGAVAWRWTESGTDTDGDPRIINGAFGDYEAALTLSRFDGSWSATINRGHGKLRFRTDDAARAYAERQVAALLRARLRSAAETMALYAAPGGVGEREKVARIILEHVSGNDPDEMIHYAHQNSWDEPKQPRWEQFAEAADAILAALTGKEQG